MALLAAVPYLHTLGHDFAFDDGAIIRKNRFIGSIPDLVTHGEWAGAGYDVRNYRPLTGVTYAINHAVGGFSPWGYHLVNVLLHAAVAACVLLLAMSWGAPPIAALAAAAIFAVHPIHAEAVANVVGRKELLATLLLLAMALAHRRAAASGGVRVGLAWLAYAGAMFAKEIGVVGIAIVAAQDLLVPDAQPPRRRARLALYAGHAIALVLYLAVYSRMLGGIAAPIVPFVDNPAAHAGSGVRVLTAIAVIWKGISLQLAPIAQSPDYSYDSIALAKSVADPRFIAAVAVLAAWAALAIHLRKRVPALAMSLVWYASPLFPVSNLAFPVGTIFGERLLYASSVGSAIAFALAAVALRSDVARRARAAAVLTVVVLLAALTVRQAATWKDDDTLFAAALRAVPRSAKVRVKLAEQALQADRPAEAEIQARAALEILPSIERARTLAARALYSLDRPDEALALLGEELRIVPDFADALYVTGAILRDRGRTDEAAGYWERALASNPGNALALSDLGAYRLTRGDPASAEKLLSAAVGADAHQASAWYNLALAREARGDVNGAREALVEFVRNAGPAYAAEAKRARAKLDLAR